MRRRKADVAFYGLLLSVVALAIAAWLLPLQHSGKPLRVRPG